MDTYIGLWGWAWVAVFLALFIGIGVWGMRKTSNDEDFAVARGASGPVTLAVAFVKSKTVFLQEPQNLPFSSVVIASQFSWQGFGILILNLLDINLQLFQKFYPSFYLLQKPFLF